MEEFKTLAKLRESKSLSQADIARLLNMTPQGYGAIERGERGLKAKKIKRLADIYDVSTDYIIFLVLNNNSKLLSRSTGTE